MKIKLKKVLAASITTSLSNNCTLQWSNLEQSQSDKARTVLNVILEIALRG